MAVVSAGSHLIIYYGDEYVTMCFLKILNLFDTVVNILQKCIGNQFCRNI